MPRSSKPPGEAPEQHAEVASLKHTAPEDVASLKAQIDDLQRQLGISEEARGSAEKAALAAAEAQGTLMQRQITEVPTGRKVKVRRALDENGRPSYKVVGYKDDGREILKPVFREVELPTYFYKIDIPPVGGMDMKINDVPLYHGAVYTFDQDTLRTVKEMVYRLWRHDADIHANDENFYRRAQSPTLSARG